MIVWDWPPESPDRLWLVIRERDGPFGLERIAVPRLPHNVGARHVEDHAVRRVQHNGGWRFVSDGAVETVEVPQVVTVEALLAAERDPTPARSATLDRRIDVLIASDLHGQPGAAVGEWSARLPELQGNATRKAERDRAQARELVARFGGILPQDPEFAHKLDVWQRSRPSYPVALPEPVRPSAQHVVALLRARDGYGQPPYPPETMAVARDILERAARASDRTSVEQLVGRFGWQDPWKVLDASWAQVPLIAC